MRVNLLTAASLCGLVFALLSGCQLLAPYKGPVAPTPPQWKTSYNSPDAGMPTIPPEWKGDLSNESASPLLKETLAKENALPATHIENQSEPRFQAEGNPDSKTDVETPSESEAKPLNFDEIKGKLDNWWEVFQDPVLNELEQQALDSSYTIWIALEKVIQARAQAAVNFSPLLPNLNFAPSFNRSGSLFQSPYASTVGNGAAGGNIKRPQSLKQWEKLAKGFKAGTNSASSSSTFPADLRFVQTEYLIPLHLDYEVDLWSQLHNSYYAAVNNAQATYQAYLGVLLSLTADVATAYFQVRGLDAQQDVVEGNIRVRAEAVKLNTARYKAGLIVYLDVSRAEVELARARSDSDDIRRLRGLQENLLGTLVGIPASVFTLDYNPIVIPPPVIPTGLPSELLCRRPDIAESERNLAASYREVGVAYANFFPSLKLNTALGFESPFASQLFNWKSRLWEVGLQLVQTVFDGGHNDANYEYYKSLCRESMADYQETVLQAFRDVEDSLVNLHGYAIRAQDLATAVKFARITLELAQMRYNRGLTNYLDVVDAERQLLETEQQAVIVLGSRYVSTVTLIRALGGGWWPCETCYEENPEIFNPE